MIPIVITVDSRVEIARFILRHSYEEPCPGINGVEKMFVRVVSMFSTNEFVAAKDGIFKLDKLGTLTPLAA